MAADFIALTTRYFRRYPTPAKTGPLPLGALVCGRIPPHARLERTRGQKLAKGEAPPDEMPAGLSLSSMRQPRLERGTYGLEGRCSIQLSYWRASPSNRDGQIRTGDPSLPKRVLYRAEPRPANKSEN